jgi:hypothetical protein
MHRICMALLLNGRLDSPQPFDDVLLRVGIGEANILLSLPLVPTAETASGQRGHAPFMEQMVLQCSGVRQSQVFAGLSHIGEDIKCPFWWEAGETLNTIETPNDEILSLPEFPHHGF